MNQNGTTKQESSGMPYPRRIMDKLAASEERKIAGDHKAAIRIVEGILNEDPACLPAVEELADNFLSLELYKQAERTAEYALKIDAESYIANYTKGFLELSRGNWKEAISYLQIANEGQHNNPEILRCLGWTLFHSGKQTEGLATLDRALCLRSDDPMILCDLGVCLLHCNSFDRAVELFEKALEVSPTNDRAQECLQAARDLQRKFQNQKNAKQGKS